MKLFKKEQYIEYQTMFGLETPVIKEMSVLAPLPTKIMNVVLTALLVVILIAVI